VYSSSNPLRFVVPSLPEGRLIARGPEPPKKTVPRARFGLKPGAGASGKLTAANVALVGTSETSAPSKVVFAARNDALSGVAVSSKE